MSKDDLRAKYGRGQANTPKMVNRAIRDEIPGGGQAIELLNDLRRRSDVDTPLGRLAIRGVRNIVYAMVDAIRARYGLSVEPREDGGQEAEDEAD